MMLRSLRLWLVVAGVLVVGGLVCLVLGVPSWWRPDPCSPGATCLLVEYDYPDRPAFLWTGAALVGFGAYGALVVTAESWLRRRRTVGP